ncbi:hypothetical protein NP493_11g09042 [Ridgeia piscesae]|uniref:DUF7402 domain-containing protein n=1 Tax=Ridgeia piscesae TaxID=27915 RepID=A0AAD9UL77_RIDPI|nr:hypothetical protein NP493_11g09042 [Ridgeia piscesae]
MAACAIRRCIHVVVVGVMLCRSPFVSAGRAVNVATRSTCTASCRPDGDMCTDCRLAINGLRYSGDWRYTGATAGGWLQIVFDKTYDVSAVFLLLPFYRENRQFKDIKLTFSDGSEHTVALTDQADGYVEENVTIVPPRHSSSVNVSVLSAFNDSERTNILSEVEVYTAIPGKQPLISNLRQTL